MHVTTTDHPPHTAPTVYAALAVPTAPLTSAVTPAAFYALRGDRRAQASALALLDPEGLFAFAGACGAYLEAQFGVAVPGLVVLVAWWNAGLLTEGAGQ
jgi:hypothetical protein